jgi:hypothetical protein
LEEIIEMKEIRLEQEVTEKTEGLGRKSDSPFPPFPPV